MPSFNHVNHDIVEADNVVNKGRKLLNRMNFTQQFWINEKLERVFPVFNISTNSLFFTSPTDCYSLQTLNSLFSQYRQSSTAQLFFQEELWLAVRCTFLCSNRTHAWVNKSCVTALFEVANST